MRFMIIVKGTEASERGEMPTHDDMAEMAHFHQELAKAGVLLDASGLRPTSKGWRVRYAGSQRTVIDGPFVEAKEVIAGYTIIDVRSLEEAQEWVRRFPNPAPDGGEAEIEVRQLFELDEFEQGPAVEQFRSLDLPSQR